MYGIIIGEACRHKIKHAISLKAALILSTPTMGMKADIMIILKESRKPILSLDVQQEA